MLLSISARSRTAGDAKICIIYSGAIKKIIKNNKKIKTITVRADNSYQNYASD